MAPCAPGPLRSPGSQTGRALEAGWEPARLLAGMVNPAQRAGWRPLGECAVRAPDPRKQGGPLGNVQCGRSTQENMEVLVVKGGRSSHGH